MYRKTLVCYLLIFSSSLSEIFSFQCYKDTNEGKKNFFATNLRNVLKYVADEIAPLPAETFLSVPEMIKHEGYNVEIHKVMTEDGYILTLFRIPGQQNSTAVFLQHGLLVSSADYVLLGRNESLAYRLADQNYDVWLGNFRGSFYSRCHESLSPNNPKFWEYSFDENGKYDLPASIKYVTNLKNDSIIYVGHSMGVMSFFIMQAKVPKMNNLIKAMFAIAPPAFFGHSSNFPIKILSLFSRLFKIIVDSVNGKEVLPLTENTELTFRYVCDMNIFENTLCSYLLDSFYGLNIWQFRKNLIPTIINHAPAVTSSKTLTHFGQLFNSGRFREYDYYGDNNMKYNRSSPPDYDLSKVKVPVALISGDKDIFISLQDLETLAKSLPNVIMNYRIKNFNHIDLLLGIDVNKMVNEKVISEMEKWRNK